MAITLRAIRAERAADIPRRVGLRIVTLFLVLELLLLAALSLIFAPAAGAAGPMKGDLTVSTTGGFARLVFKFPEEIEADVHLNNGIVVINFRKPVDVSVDRLSAWAQTYVNAARRDPDGTAIRLALGRKLTVNSMIAGERLFVDLLPENWTGVPPGLPQDVIEELARRAREAEKKVRQREALLQQRRLPPIRVRVGTLPTFTRYVFELPELIPVSTSRDHEKLKLTFDAPLKFDLGDVLASLPPTVAGIESASATDTNTVTFSLIGKVDVRTFREDNSFVVDVGMPEPKADPATFFNPAEVPPNGDPKTAAARVRTPQAAQPSPPQTPAQQPATPAQRPAERPATPQRQTANPGPKPALAAVQPAKPAEASPPPAPAAAAPPAAEPKPEPPAVAEVKPVPAQSAPAKPAPVAATAPSDAEVPAGPSAPTPSLAGLDGTQQARDPNAPVVAEVQPKGDALNIVFPFASSTPAAVFRRADTLWIVFDTAVPINVGALVEKSQRTIRSADVSRSHDGQVIRLKLERPRLTSAVADGATWTVILGDVVLEPTLPLGITRAIVGPGRSNALIPFDDPRQLHRVADPDIGDTLLVTTGLAPARGFLKTQDFVEFRALASTQGVVIQPLADDVFAELAPDKIVINRPGGLTLSAFDQGIQRTGIARPILFDTQLWGFDKQADFRERQMQLLLKAAEAADSRRGPTRYDLARFYIAQDMYAEAKAVLDLALSSSADDASPMVMRAIAEILMGRPEEGLKDLANPAVGNQHDAPLWRALAYARQGKWTEALAGFKAAAASTATLPIELQRLVFKEYARASIEARDFAGAANELNELTSLGITKESDPTLAVLSGRLAEGLGRTEEALTAYRLAADTRIRPLAAQGRLRELVLRIRLGDLKPTEAIAELETLTATWRGDETETEALQLLARLYTGERRYRDAFQVMRTALSAHPNSEMTRRIHDEAATTFDSLFLDGKGDSLAPIDALGLFYDFRELTPIGRRGDEMIRRLADRLVAVDLLKQATELLQHQVDHRLQGAARAQVAVRLAIIYLMNRKPELALATLRSTRVSELPQALRNQRLLVEARALSDTGRPDVAIEVIANVEGREAERLRADVLWTARRWTQAAEQIEKLLGDRWREWQPLNDGERTDVLRAGIGYALGEDAIGLDRLREKFAAKMADGPDRRSFEVVTAPLTALGTEFKDVVKSVAAIDTLDGFLSELRTRYPDGQPLPPDAAKPAVRQTNTGALTPQNRTLAAAR